MRTIMNHSEMGFVDCKQSKGIAIVKKDNLPTYMMASREKQDFSFSTMDMVIKRSFNPVDSIPPTDSE